MDNKRLLSVFSPIAVFVWTFSLWGPPLQIGLSSPRFFNSQFSLNSLLLLFFVCLYVYLQNRLIKRVLYNNGLVAREMLISVFVFVCVFMYAILISLVGFTEEHFRNLCNLFIHVRHGADPDLILGLISSSIDNEGMDIVLCFFLGLSSGLILYPLKTRSRITNTEFIKLLSIWFFIFFINEVVIQTLLSNRSGTLGDIFNNTLGASLGLSLSIRSVKTR